MLHLEKIQKKCIITYFDLKNVFLSTVFTFELKFFGAFFPEKLNAAAKAHLCKTFLKRRDQGENWKKCFLNCKNTERNY